MSFQRPGLTTDPGTLAANAKALLEEELPGWKPAPNGADPISLIIDAFSFAAAEQAEILELELIEALKGFGSLVGVPPIPASPATATVTFTLEVAAPVAGFVIPTGAEVGIRNANGELEAFRVATTLTITSGNLTGEAPSEAVQAGTEGNGLSGTATLISTPPGVATAVFGVSGGGVDEEEEAVYLQRLIETLAVMKPGPVRAADAAVIARKIAGVFRATAVDLLKPAAADGGEGTEEANVEKCVTVACTDVNGVASDAGHLASVKELLQSLREANFKFFVVKPHYTSIDVSSTVYAWPGANLAAVKAEVETALKEKLSPARWGTDATGDPARWANTPLVRQGDLMAGVHQVANVRWLSRLELAKHGGTLGTANVTLGEGSSVPALPEAGTLTVTVEPST